MVRSRAGATHAAPAPCDESLAAIASGQDTMEGTGGCFTLNLLDPGCQVKVCPDPLHGQPNGTRALLPPCSACYCR